MCGFSFAFFRLLLMVTAEGGRGMGMGHGCVLSLLLGHRVSGPLGERVGHCSVVHLLFFCFNFSNENTFVTHIISFIIKRRLCRKNTSSIGRSALSNAPPSSALLHLNDKDPFEKSSVTVTTSLGHSTWPFDACSPLKMMLPEEWEHAPSPGVVPIIWVIWASLHAMPKPTSPPVAHTAMAQVR